jgi:hypothetical protein
MGFGLGVVYIIVFFSSFFRRWKRQLAILGSTFGALGFHLYCEFENEKTRLRSESMVWKTGYALEKGHSRIRNITICSRILPKKVHFTRFQFPLCQLAKSTTLLFL